MSDESKETPQGSDKAETEQSPVEAATAAADKSANAAESIAPVTTTAEPLSEAAAEKAAPVTGASTAESATEKLVNITIEKPVAAKPETKSEPAAPPEEGAKPAPPKAAPPPRAAPVAASAAAGHKPPPPAKKGPTVTEEITDDPFIDKLKGKFGDAITEAVKTYGQRIVRVKKDAYLEVCQFLVADEDGAFDMCADLTALHWPDKAGEEFDIVVNLYSVSKNTRLRVKTAIADSEAAPSVTQIWQGADWMEREVFDMFGIKFDGHPDLRRILLPEDWPGFPLRKEYPIEYRDNEWTDKHIDYLEVDYDTSLIDVKYAQRR